VAFSLKRLLKKVRLPWQPSAVAAEESRNARIDRSLASVTAEYRCWLRRQARPRVIPHPELSGRFLVLPENCAARLRVDPKFLDGYLGATSWPLCFVARSIPEAVKAYYASLEHKFKLEQLEAKCARHLRRFEYEKRTGKPAPAYMLEDSPWDSFTSGNVEAIMAEAYTPCRSVPLSEVPQELPAGEMGRRLKGMWESA